MDMCRAFQRAASPRRRYPKTGTTSLFAFAAATPTRRYVHLADMFACLSCLLMVRYAILPVSHACSREIASVYCSYAVPICYIRRFSPVISMPCMGVRRTRALILTLRSHPTRDRPYDVLARHFCPHPCYLPARGAVTYGGTARDVQRISITRIPTYKTRQRLRCHTGVRAEGSCSAVGGTHGERHGAAL